MSNKAAAETIETHIAQGENERVAFLRERVRTDELAEVLAALANHDGGIVYIGIGGKTRPRIEGVEDIRSAERMVLEATLLVQPPLILPVPQRVQADQYHLLLVEVPAGLPNVYSIHGKYLNRTGSANAPLPTHRLRELLLERGDVRWDRQVPPDATPDDLDLAKIQRYSERTGSLAADDPWEWLHRRGCVVVRDGTYVPTNAGLLLFARHVERHFPQCEVTLIRYTGVERSDAWERDDIRDTLPEQIRRAQNWIIEHMRKGSRMAGLEREDWTEYPEGAVREMLVNAVAHRDYAVRGEGIRIVMFADRMECYSPGRLPGHVTVENIQSERYSRNEVLVQVLSDMLLIERLGYGIDRILNQMSSAQLPPPTFQETPAGFMVKLQGRAQAQAGLQGVDTRAWLKQGLNERQIAALLYLTEHQRITNRDYRDLQAAVSDETVRRDLADLVERGLLLRIGDRRGTYYILR